MAEAGLGARLELFIGNVDGSTTDSWCSKCRLALPVVLASISVSRVPLVVVGVGKKDDWITRSSPVQVDAGLALESVPTLRVVDECGTEATHVLLVSSKTMCGSVTEHMRDLVDAMVRKHLPNFGQMATPAFGAFQDDFELRKKDVVVGQPDVRDVRADKLAAEELSTALEAKGLLVHASEASYRDLVGSMGSHLELFVGNADGSTNMFWCLDCYRAVPAILAAALSKGVPIVAVGVGEKNEWKPRPSWAKQG
eukprot:gnl/TRDRNA2_/TRDRNA2_171844_c1_seq3.p1 gnl/TRDRNA2_/TRDRNA2_171844_c1~~gnl/TRDRNA2_/TRDRNA2_171844_c1_seq3.p1  ORF type:complete len:286 (+),score=44.62 gnl/TRDRNA2_/TRDRNA2_171844_c1_seq3:101-859(+)